MQIVTGQPAPTVPPAQAAALLGEMAAVVRTIFAVRAPAVPDAAPVTPAPPTPIAPSPVAAVPAPVPLVAIPMPELDELAFLDE